MELYFFFTKVFALSFSLGVVSGVTMSFQFGTNWPGFMNTVGNIAGPLLAYEVLSAFFLEATFLGVMLFGFRKVKPWVHSLATFLVAVGTTLSAFWILALGSWMQTPAGFKLIDGVAHATSWMEIIFNPSMPHRFFHTLVASGLTASFLITGLLSYRYLLGDERQSVKAGLKSALWVAFFLAPVQAFLGDLHGINTREYQPQKLAAMEALWNTTQGAPLTLFALPDELERNNRWAVEIPKLGSLIITRSLDGQVKGLNEFSGNHPPVAPVFFSFRLMVGTGALMILVSSLGAYYINLRKIFPRFFLKGLVAMTFSGWLATVAGWYVTEIGRQPWLVTGVLKSSSAVASVPPSYVGVSLIAYLLTYTVLLLSFVWTIFYLAKAETQKPRYEKEA